MLHFDAHCDTWSSHAGEPSGHGTWVYEAMQEGLVVQACFTQIGLRSAGVRAARDQVAQRGGCIHTARALRGCASPAQWAPVLDGFRNRLREHGDPPVYLSLDIDCLADVPFVGMDCVEVAPAYDHVELTSAAAAVFVWTYLCGRIATTRA